MAKRLGDTQVNRGRPRKERFDLDKVLENSPEEVPNMMTFVVLEGKKIGFEIDWEKQTVMFFLYLEKKRNIVRTSEILSWYAGNAQLQHALYRMIVQHYKSIGKKPRIPMYAEMELAIPVTQLNYHIWAGTLDKVLQKEVITS